MERYKMMITMKDIIRDGHPTLRKKAEEVSFPLDRETYELGNRMMEFLLNSQDPKKAEQFHLRAGVGLAAPQVNVSKRITAVHIPSPDPEKEDEIIFSDILFNPRITSHAVQEACLKEGEGCLSVDREIEGFVPRSARITLEYFNAKGEKQRVKLRGYEAIVIQHEIDHLNGIMFYDHINEDTPFSLKEDTKII